MRRCPLSPRCCCRAGTRRTAAIAAEGGRRSPAGGGHRRGIVMERGEARRRRSLTIRELGARRNGSRVRHIEPVGVAAPLRVLASPPSGDVLVACDEPGGPAVALAAELVRRARTRRGRLDRWIRASRPTSRRSGRRARGVAAPPSPGVSDPGGRRRRPGPAVMPGRARRGSITGVVGGSGGVGTSAVALALAQLSGAALVGYEPRVG